ncbi:uncharacterized protein [Venturia canescens]|uniref:uncharacterized protein n=1 Tax=Venturia canescens TaxID=32260 RepID=UPI001C9CF85C|nr:uncharacterized protein LOC122419238 [Venturia canescens]
MAKAYTLLAIIVILAACTCGVRTECPNRVQISVLTAVHDDPACTKVSTKGVLLFEAAKLLADAHNNKTHGFKFETTVMDTCGSVIGAVKSAMKALVWADMNCLYPPYFLGIIGPDSATNADAVHKITSVLGIPHIVRKPSNSPYLHHLAKESDNFIAQGILKVVEALKWKSFTLVADGDNEDDVQNIAKKVTSSAIARGLCVMVHDNEEEDLTSQIVHIGKPVDDFFRTAVNSTILVASEGNLENYLNRINSSNTIILLEDARNAYEGLEEKVEKSRWWNGDEGVGKYDDEELREVRWLENAIKVYSKALDTLCKKKKCKNQLNSADWNKVLDSILTVVNADIQSTSKTLDIAIKKKSGTLEKLGHVTVMKNHAKIQWKGQSSSEADDDDAASSNNDEDDDDADDTGSLPEIFKRIQSKEKEKRAGCATTTKEIKMLHAEDDDEAARVLLTEMDESEWWTMVGTVSGVGVAMFVVGILAVYVVYSNIRGPRTPKSKGRSIERDTSLRRVGSDREPPVAARNQRNSRAPQRRDSNRSIRSTMSDKSV